MNILVASQAHGVSKSVSPHDNIHERGWNELLLVGTTTAGTCRYYTSNLV